MPHRYLIETPFHPVWVSLTDETIINIAFKGDTLKQTVQAPPLLTELKAQLDAYWRNPRHQFDLPLQQAKTPFQAKVRQALINLSSGETTTYGAIADSLSSSPRAVGNACRHNPFPILVPCHRIVAKQHIGGYSGDTSGRMLDFKTKILQHEASQT